MIHKTFSLIGGVLALLLSFNAQALPITLATGESALFNFDLTTEGPAPLTNVELVFDVTGPGGGGFSTLTFTVSSSARTSSQRFLT